MFRLQYRAIILLLFCSTACSSAAPLVVEPTQKLIVPTVTNTPIPQTPTLTLTPLPRASDLSSPTPIIDEQATTSANPALDDPVAAALVGLAQRRVADTTTLP